MAYYIYLVIHSLVYYKNIRKAGNYLQMKVYKFYLYKKNIRHEKYPAISEDNIFETKNGKFACLYGYTDSKDIRDEFIEYRNMNIFKMKEENMSKERFEAFSQLYPDELLEYNSFGTNVVECGNTVIRPIPLVVTNKEYDMVFMDCNMIAEGSLYDLFKDITQNADDPTAFYDNVFKFQNMFKHDITEALEYLEFTNVMFEYFSPESSELPYTAFPEDKLMAYIKLFRNTFKEGVL